MGKNEFEWLDNTGSNAFQIESKDALKDTIEGKMKKFILEATGNARKYKLIGSGKLASTSGFKYVVSKTSKVVLVEIYMIYYGLFQNYGVKGWGNKANAPDSPYSFKSTKMSEDGRRSIKQMIQRGRRTTRNVKSAKVGLEQKSSDKKSAIDTEVSNAIYNITKYGIKKKPFFTEAYTKYFGTFDRELMEAVSKTIISEIAKK